MHGEQNNRCKHGLYSAEALAEQKRVRELLAQSRELLKQVQAGRTVRLTGAWGSSWFLSNSAVGQVIGYESPFRRPRTNSDKWLPFLLERLGSAMLREFGWCRLVADRKTLPRPYFAGMISNSKS
jgi:hypothetical protein